MDVFTYKGILPDCSFKSTQMHANFWSWLQFDSYKYMFKYI